MKVIMIKNYDKYKIDEIVEVSDGFGSNFLIKNGYALPLNKETSKQLEIRNEEKKKNREIEKQKALELKNKIEALELNFYLKTTNNVIHGSITGKKVNQQLIEKGIKLDKHVLPHISIASLGTSKINIKLFDGVEAILKVNIKGEHGK